MQTPGDIYAATETVRPLRSDFPDLNDEEVALLMEYWETWPKLQQLYSNLQMTGTRTIKRHLPANAQLDVIEQITYFSRNATEFRVDVDSTTFDEKFIGIINPEKQYLIVQPNDGEPYLKGHGNNLEEAQWELCRRSMHAVPFTDHLGLSLAAKIVLGIPEIPSNSDAYITSITSRKAVDTGEIVVINYHRASTTTITIEYFRDRLWALKSYRMDVSLQPSADNPSGASNITEITLEYDQKLNAIPLLKSYERIAKQSESANFENMQLAQHETFQVTSLTPVAAHAKIFDPQAILGVNIDRMNEGPPARWWIFFLNGIALFLIGLYLLRKKQSSATSEQ